MSPICKNCAWASWIGKFEGVCRYDFSKIVKPISIHLPLTNPIWKNFQKECPCFKSKEKK